MLDLQRIGEKAPKSRDLVAGAAEAWQISKAEDLADADRIDEVFDAIVDCDSGAEFFARVRA